MSDAELRQLAGSVCPGAEGDVEDHPPLSFSTTFDPHSTGIVDSIRDRALEGQTAGTELRVELGLLGVYGTLPLSSPAVRAETKHHGDC